MNPEIFRFLANFNGKIYLVGGFIRDTLLKNGFKLPPDLLAGNDVKDIDIVVFGNLDRFLEEFSSKFRKKYIVLKEEIRDYRIILGKDRWIDVAAPRGEDIFEDLKRRDFTINSMAVDVNEPGKLIDPIGGLDDLKKGLVRSYSRTNLEEDPLRILRGFRFLSILCFSIEEKTLSWMEEVAPQLRRVSPERIRYEIFQIFSGKCLPEAIDLMAKTEVLFAIFPELKPLKVTEQVYYGRQNLLEHTLLAVKNLHNLIWNFDKYEWLAPYRKYFDPYISSEHWRALMLLGALFHDIAKPETLTRDEEGKTHFYGHDKVGSRIVEEIATRLKFSNFEKDVLVTFVKSHMHPHLISRDSDRTKRAVNRFLRKLGDLAFPLVLFSFADAMASPPTEGLYEGHKKLLQMMVEIVEEKSRKKERLVTGYDLINMGLEPSPIFKKILEEIDDLFAEGIIKTREDALKYIEEKWLVKGGKR